MRSGMAAMLLMAAAMGAPAVSRWPLAFSEERKESPPASGQLPAASDSAASAALSLGKAHAASGAPVSARARLEEARRSRDPAVRAMAAFWLDILQRESPHVGIERAITQAARNGDLDAAVKRLRGLLSQRPFDAKLHNALADLYGRYRTDVRGLPYAVKEETMRGIHHARTRKDQLYGMALLLRYLETQEQFYYAEYLRAQACCPCSCADRMMQVVNKDCCYQLDCRKVHIACEACCSYFKEYIDFKRRAEWHYREMQEKGLAASGEKLRSIQEERRFSSAVLPSVSAIETPFDHVMAGGMSIVYPKGGEKKAAAMTKKWRVRHSNINANATARPSIFLVPVEKSLLPN